LRSLSIQDFGLDFAFIGLIN